jgi:isoleucyl-tRNA synthetase
MKETREMVSLSLEKRAASGIKVRQPLKTLRLPDSRLKDNQELINLIKEEVNVKEVIFEGSQIELQTEITPELKEEGLARDFTRAVQGLRKEENLSPSDEVGLAVSVDFSFLKSFQGEIKKTAGLSEIVIKENGGKKVRIGDEEINMEIIR